MDVLNNVLAPDSAPTTASTIDGTVPHNRVILDVSVGAIYWQVKQGQSLGMADWTPAIGVFMTPGSRRLPTDGKVYGVRFWAAATAASLGGVNFQARVTAMME